MSRRTPRYPDDSDYSTNAPSYYDDLSRKSRLIQLLAKRIWEYDEELAKRFAEWDKNLEEFDNEVLKLLQEWMDDGTFAHIINEEIFSWKADTEDLESLEEFLLEEMATLSSTLTSDMSNLNESIQEDMETLQNYLLNEVNSTIMDLSNRVDDIEDFKQLEIFDNNIWTWWIYPLAQQRKDKTFFTSVDNNGNYYVNSFNHVSKEYVRVHLFNGYADDHNAPSINFLNNGRPIIFYTQHNTDNLIRYRIGNDPFTIENLGPERTFTTNQPITYTQSYVDNIGDIHLFTRRANTGWYYLRSKDNGNTWGTFRTLQIENSGQFYLKIKPRMADDGVEQIRMVFTGHPQNSPHQAIYYCYMNLYNGNIHIPQAGGGEPLIIGNVLEGSGVVLETSDMQTVYTPIQGRSTRLFDVGDESLGISFVEFTDGTDGTDGMYKYALWNGNGFSVLDIAPTGRPIGGGGNRGYFGGIVQPENTDNELIVSREENGLWFIERKKLVSGNWETTVLHEDNEKMFRPIVPLGNNENVMYVRGEYSEDNFSDFNTDLVFPYNTVSVSNAYTDMNRQGITGLSNYYDNHVTVFGLDDLIIQRSNSFIRVPTSYNNDESRFLGEREVTFSKAFTRPPDVFVSSRNVSFNVIPALVTENGFTINVERSVLDVTPDDVPVHWFAIGV